MKKPWIAILIVVVIIGGLWAWSANKPEARLEVIRPRVEGIRAYVEEQAVTELPHDYLVSMPISGWLERIDLREGDAVKKGQIVARLEKHDLEDHVRQAEQGIAVLQTQIKKTQDHRLEKNMLVETVATVKAIDETVKASEAKLGATLAVFEFARSEVERLTELAKTGAATDREIRAAETQSRRANAAHQGDRLDLAALKTLAAVSYIGPKFMEDYIDRKDFDVDVARQQLVEATANLEIQKRNLARAELACPIDGVVLQRYQTRRQFLQAGTPLLTIGRLDDMEVTAEILTQRASRIDPGDAVEIHGEAIPDGPVTGKVLRVYPAGFKKISSLGVEQQRVKVAVKLDKRPERLGVEFRVHVRIIYDEADKALTLPRTALFRDERGGWQVMIVRDRRTQLAAVKVGLMNDDQAQIVDGLVRTDDVVAQPSREIVAGMRVEVVPRD